MNYEETGLSRQEALKYRLSLRECLIGDKAFYSRLALVVVPMIIQNTLTNVVSLLDNVMVGQVGTLPMSAVAIVGQLMFVFYLGIFGTLSGAGIFGTQYIGKGDYEGVRNAIRFKLIAAAAIGGLFLTVFGLAGPALIGRYIAESTTAADRELTMRLALQYLHIMMVGMIPFALTQVYGSTLREAGYTTIPMRGSMIAMAVNFVLNALLIFGLFGLPKMGVAGAAVATVVSRFVEMAIVVGAGCRNTDKFPFFAGIFRNFRIPGNVAREILIKTLPLSVNEILWSLGQAQLMQSYSVRGIEVIAAINISNTISQIFNEVFISLGGAAGIIVGQELGANRLVGARRTAWRMAAASLMSTIVMGGALFAVAPLIPQIYNTEAEIRQLATTLIRIVAVCMPIHSFANVSYFIMRSGGRTLVTFFFDSCFSWIVSVPLAYILATFTSLPPQVILASVMSADLIKCAIGFVLVKKGVWVRNIVTGMG